MASVLCVHRRKMRDGNLVPAVRELTHRSMSSEFPILYFADDLGLETRASDEEYNIATATLSEQHSGRMRE